MQVLVINFFFFALEIVSGFIAGSMGLLPIVWICLRQYRLWSFVICGRGNCSTEEKYRRNRGLFPDSACRVGFVEVVVVSGTWRDAGISRDDYYIFTRPCGQCQLPLSASKSKSKEAHMQASMIFTSTDVIVNLGVIVAGVLVYVTGSKMPDLA